MLELIDVGDKIASMVSALVGLVALILTFYRYRRSRRRAKLESRPSVPAGVEQYEGSEVPSEPEPATDGEPDSLGPPRERAVVQLSAVWLMATVLMIFAILSDSYNAYFAGLGLMGVVLAVSLLAVAISGYRQLRSAWPFTGPQSRKRLIARAVAMLPLMLTGYLLAELASNLLSMPVVWIVPVFVTAFGAVAATLSLAGGQRAGRILTAPRTRAATHAMGAIVTGLVIGVVVLFAEHGPSRSFDLREKIWSTGDRVEGAYAEGTVRRTSGRRVQLSGTLLDTVKNGLGARLNIDVQHADGRSERISESNSHGEGKVVVLGGNAGGHVFPEDIRSIDVTICLTAKDGAGGLVPKTCGAPKQIWSG